METDRLNYFCTIVEMGSITKASEILSVSHSGLSKAISTLESELKIKLFRPQGRGLMVTEEGKKIFEKSLAILELCNQLQSLKIKSTTKTRIGLSEVIAMNCSGDLANAFSDGLCLFIIDAGELEGKVLSGELDFGISFVPNPKSEMEYLKIGMISFHAYEKSELIQKFPNSEIPFVVPTEPFPTNPMNYKHRDGWPLDLLRNSKFFVNRFSSAIDLMNKGVAAAHIPDFVAKLENSQNDGSTLKKLKAFEEIKVDRPLYLVKSKSSEETSDMKKAVKVIRKLCFS